MRGEQVHERGTGAQEEQVHEGGRYMRAEQVRERRAGM